MNMPISEDELDNRHPTFNNEPSSTMSKAELRKTHKPIMEKRRRARINQCLNEIKTLILEAMKKDHVYVHMLCYHLFIGTILLFQPARHSKLEKADILEMAVKHLQNVQRQQLAMAIAGDPTVLRRFKTGFEECARQVSTYIDQIDPDEDATTTTQNNNYYNNGLKGRIAEHLAKCMGGIEHIARFNLGAGGFPFSRRRSTPQPTIRRVPMPLHDDLNNNPTSVVRQQSQSILHLIPSRLPTGELAFLVPNSNNLSKLSRLLLNANNNNSRQYSRGNNNNSDLFSTVSDNSNRHHSAFVAVTPSSATNEQVSQSSSSSTISPPPSPADEDVVTSQRSSSPKRAGFRPFNSALQKSYRSAFLSTAKLGVVDLKVDADQKSAEPLCIITNQSERFKRAQILANSVDCEENRRGLKRQQRNADQADYAADVELSHSSHDGGGLLIVSGNNNRHDHRSKVMKTSRDNTNPSQFRHRFNYNLRDTSTNIESTSSQFNTSRESTSDNGVDNSDMWRPW
ncbi:basic helix-loop-helix transcription factor hes-related [Holotrichia oblita]|uniref:Basic helix-loop-helix transcription factor hes-related n=1 Tax=Holotrichia oblita TaxID=644536 RepID=A0ACB9T6G8_HOLOL|nr:basic helix-loop-helix transcription factor hes-related [Holotrichia oblita]